MDYFRPENLAEALEIAADPSVCVAAGCTDLFPATQQQRLPGRILDITGIAALRGITRTDNGWRIGATATWTNIVKADLPPAFDALKQAAVEVGAVQIQNSGTVAGNLCNASPAADGVPPLLALDASVEVRSAKGGRTVPLGDFITGVRQTSLQPGEIVTAITVPHTAGGRSRFLKLGARKHLVISIVMAAVRLDVLDGRVASAAVSVGSCSPVAVRLPCVEAALTGAAADAGLCGLVQDADVAEALSPIADIRADAGYRIEAATELVRRAVDNLTTGERAAA